MRIIDVHSHINILGEKSYGMIDSHDEIRTVIINALDIKSYENILSYRKKYYDNGGKKNICITLGLYPPSELKKDFENSIIKEYDDNLDVLISRIKSDKSLLSGIGEIGLDGNAIGDDYHNDKNVFIRLLELARDVSLPAIIHSRKAEKDVIEALMDYDGIAVLHTFTGKKALIKKILQNNRVYFSVPCILSHSEQFKSLVSLVPLSRLLTETDSPFMPIRGKEYSEPIDIIHTINNIASIKSINPTEASQALYMNARRVFKHS